MQPPPVQAARNLRHYTAKQNNPGMAGAKAQSPGSNLFGFAQGWLEVVPCYKTKTTRLTADYTSV